MTSTAGKQVRKDASESESQSEEESEDANMYQKDGFVVDDDDEEEEEETPEEQKKKKSKKKRKRSSSYDDLADDDLEILNQYDNRNARSKFKRLKAQKQKEDEEAQEQSYHVNQDEMEEEVDEDIIENDMQYSDNNSEEDDGREQYEHNNNIEDIFEPAGLEQIYIKKEDELIVKADIPERLQLKFKGRLEQKDIKEELPEEARWIFQRMRDKFDDRRHDRVKERILKVLELIRIEYCEVMYIYYYRRLVWSDELTLEHLWKIYQLDDEWATVKELKKGLNETTMRFLNNLGLQIHPSVQRLMEKATDVKVLKLLKQHIDFELHRKNFDIKKKQEGEGEEQPKSKKKKKVIQGKPNLVAQVEKQHDLVRAIKKEKFWLTPAQLYENIQERNQRYRPYTPDVNPNKEFERFIDAKKPLFASHSLHRTITKYLELQLLTYPQLRRWINENYKKRIVVSSILTKKGEHDINLYSQYFPVKRLIKKPVTSFRGDLWLLMLEAEKEGFIKIQMFFDWQVNAATVNYDSDPVYNDLVSFYFDHSQIDSNNSYMWNRYRMEIIKGLLQNQIVPALHRQIKQDLYRDAEKDVITQCGQKLRAQLNKGPAMKRDGKPPVILALVLQNDKLGLAFVSPQGELLFKGTIKVSYESSIEFIVKDRVINEYIDEYKPDLIVISANRRESILLRKELREVKQARRPTREQFCALGEYEICSLIAKRQIMRGSNEERAILEAISLARLKLNGMAQILTIWSQKIEDNGVLYMNMHPLQKSINQQKLKAQLERVAVEMVNLVGIDINQVKDHLHLQNQLQFVCGLGPRKALNLLENLKKTYGTGKEIRRRRQLLNQKMLGDIVYRNCSGFFKIMTKSHKDYLETLKIDKKSNDMGHISLIDITRIHDEWYKTVEKACLVAVSDASKKKVPDEDQSIAQVLKNPSKLRNIEMEKNGIIDQELICSQFAHPFKDPRDPEAPIDNKDIFFSILRETPETLKKYMIFSVKIIGVAQHFLTVKIVQNGLMGSIRLGGQSRQHEFKKDNVIKAVIVRFPFDPADNARRHHENRMEAHHEEQELLKVEMALNFPYVSSKAHNYIGEFFDNIVKEIHPRIDSQHFQIKIEDIPVIEVKEEVRTRTQLRFISHPKFKNIGISKAIEWVSSEPIGEFLIRPSSTGGKDYLTITWKFYQGVIAHVPIKTQSKSMTGMSYQYKIESSRDPRIYNSFDEIIEYYIKPINRLMQDVAANRKFLAQPLDVIEEKLKLERQKDNTIIHYYFGCSKELPEFITLLYIERDNKVVREHIKVKDDGLAFHGQKFRSVNDLVQWFKKHFKDKDYKNYVPRGGILPARH